MNRINVVIASVLIFWAYQGLEVSSLVAMKDHLMALGIALFLQPWVERQLD